MSKVNCIAFRRDRAKQLDDLAAIFESAEICKDVSPIRIAAEQCRQIDNKAKFWAYDINGLLFDVDVLRHIVPQGVYDVRLLLDVSVRGECRTPESTDDPLTNLTIDIAIQGRREKDKTLICTWHLDRHINPPSGAAPEDAHPQYHFQFGGRGMRGLSDLGEALILDPPRLAHPPLDGMLAIDFVLSNYCSSKWRTLRGNNQYTNLIKDAQELIWKPYANIIIAAWNPPTGKLSWFPHQVWPQLVSA